MAEIADGAAEEQHQDALAVAPAGRHLQQVHPDIRAPGRRCRPNRYRPAHGGTRPAPPTKSRSGNNTYAGGGRALPESSESWCRFRCPVRTAPRRPRCARTISLACAPNQPLIRARHAIFRKLSDHFEQLRADRVIQILRRQFLLARLRQARFEYRWRNSPAARATIVLVRINRLYFAVSS